MHQYITQLRSEFHTQNEDLKNVVRLQHDDLRVVVWSKNEVLEAELKAELRATVQTINDLKRAVNSLYARESEDGTIDFNQLAQVRYASSVDSADIEEAVQQNVNEVAIKKDAQLAEDRLKEIEEVFQQNEAIYSPSLSPPWS
ncbi:uncharacterized protein PHALS_06292 [Plasmopara halstedii]|uniref:Uncharacterized protein n=1 Tax=Plasmopara halstedii TaxID=4781 RepID=A0A0P1B149_PLAHL|nr:uncharacterized protein PHALS_06292 [Plasmopara halstedii]CEG48472.1 hypothetical protein PHALS_06292 [Plasmopara halstedii]|eukprot:XP_024584841.1 hypothetical protein PHALS_06292 [Plasmopara halstedii]